MFGSLAQNAAPMAFATSYDSRAALKSYFDGLRAEWEMIHFHDERIYRRRGRGGRARLSLGATNGLEKK